MLGFELLYYEALGASRREAGPFAELGTCECVIHKSAQWGAPLVTGVLSEVESKGNIEIGAGLGHHPLVSWKTHMRPFLKMKEKVALNGE